MRRFLGFLVALALLLVAAVVLVPRFVSEEMLRTRLVAALEPRLERPVQLDKVGFGFRPMPSVHAEGVTLGRSPKNPQDVRIEKLDFFLALRPLFRRQVEVRSLSIDGLTVDVYLETGGLESGDPSGQPNPDSPVGGRGESTPPGSPTDSEAPGGERPVAETPAATGGTKGAFSQTTVDIEALVIRDGHIRVFRDGELLLELTGLEEDLAATLSPEGGLVLSGQTRVGEWALHTPTGKLGRQMPAVLDKSLHYDPTKESLEIANAALDLGGLPVSIQGTATSLSADPMLDFTFEGGPSEIENIMGVLPSGWVEQAAGLRSAGRLSVKGSVRGPVGPGVEPAFSLSLELENGRLSGGDLPAPVEGIVGRLLVTPDKLEIQSLAAQSGSSKIAVRGNIAGYREQPRLDLAIDGDLDLALAGVLNPVEGAPQLSGRAVVQGVVRGTPPPAGATTASKAGGSGPDVLDFIEPLGTFELRDVAVRGIEQPVEGMSGKGTLRNRELQVTALQFRIGESDFQLDGRVSDFRTLDPVIGNSVRASSDLTLRSRFFDGDAFSAAAQAAGSKGAAGAGGPGSKAPGAGEPNGAQPGTSRPNGSASGSGVNPTIPSGFELFAGLLSRLTGPVRVNMDRARLQGIEWKEVRAAGAVRSGVIDIGAMTMKAFAGDVATSGSVDVRDPASPKFDLELRGTGIEAKDFLAGNPGLARLSGLGNFVEGQMEFKATADGSLLEDFSLDLRALTSAGNLKIRDGGLSGHPVQNALSTYLGQTDLKRLPIRDWLQPFRIRNGRVEFEDLQLQVGEFTLVGNGFTGLDGQMSLRGELLVPEARAANLRSKLPAAAADVLLGGKSGPVILPIKVSGPVTKPAVQIDDERLTARARAKAEEEITRKKEELKNRARTEVKDRGGELLDDLIKRGAKPDSSRADTTAAEIKKEVRGLIKGIFGK